MKRIPISVYTLAITAALIFSCSTYGSDRLDTGGSVLVHFSMFTGNAPPDPGDTENVMIVPGVVIPMDPGLAGSESDIAAYLEKYGDELEDISGKLTKTFRLEQVALQTERTKYMAPGESVPLPSPGSNPDITLSVRHLGTAESVTTFQVVCSEGQEPIIDTSVSITHGKRAVVGGMDGESAPYFFLVVEPLNHLLANSPEGQGFEMPQADSMVPPVYPEDCRKEKIQGNVVVSAIIGEDGMARDIQVLSSPHPSLSSAAISAIKTWRYKPATIAGQPVEVMMNLTVRFKLE